MGELTRWDPITRWNPLKELEEMEKRLATLFGRTGVRKEGEREEAMTVAEWSPLVDISEDDKEYLIKAELPEVKKDQIKLTVHNGVMTISGERTYEKEEKGKKFHRVERAYGSFTRSFTIPDDADDANISAESKGGVLLVHLPKTAKRASKSVEIKVG
jgi:HSP20 family protein